MTIDKQRDGTSWSLPSDEQLLENPGNWSLALRLGTVAARVEHAMHMARALGVHVYFKAQTVNPGDLSFIGGFPFMEDRPASKKADK